jgi:Flp pilus assembly protein TadG
MTLAYLATLLGTLVVVTGLAVDSGRAYVVKAQLTKAVDGAALGAARNLNTGDPRGEAERIFKANFPAGYFGTSSSTDPTTATDFFHTDVIESSGVNVVTVTASAVLPTTFMRLAKFDEVTVTSSGQATRRMVDLSLVIDKSSSIGPAWTAVHDAAVNFINSFDQNQDRLSLITFGDSAQVLDLMPSGRGFNKTKLKSDVPTAPTGSTAMVEGLYRGWDELRSVPTGSQSGLRVIVLFTDGASNSVPALWDSATVAKGLRTFDFPQNPGDTHLQTHNMPYVVGLFDTETGAPSSGINFSIAWNDRSIPPTALPTWAQWMPATSKHTHHRSSGIPTTFPLQTNQINVDGVAQSTARGLRDQQANGTYPSQVWNINNAARNLVEIIANAARSDTDGDHKIRIFTIGMGELVPLLLGTRPESSESILMRMANDPRSTDHNPDQLDGSYYYAKTAGDVGPAFQALQNQIVRLSK